MGLAIPLGYNPNPEDEMNTTPCDCCNKPVSDQDYASHPLTDDVGTDGVQFHDSYIVLCDDCNHATHQMTTVSEVEAYAVTALIAANADKTAERFVAKLEQSQHPFELSGNGKAPFKCIGVVTKVGPMVINQENGITTTVGAPGQPVGTCDHCGTGIKYCFQIVSADGNHFEVGSSCVAKTGDHRLDREMRTHKRVIDQQIRDARKQAKRAVRDAQWRKDARAGMRRALTDNPALGLALRVDHRITRDIRANFIKWGNLSEKQVALVFKLQADELRPAESTVAVPEGRQEIVGEVVSIKLQDSGFGYAQEKMLVKVTTDAGYFKVYGTLPASISDVERGQLVRFTATLKPKESGFGFFSRPAKAEIIGGALEIVDHGEDHQHSA